MNVFVRSARVGNIVDLNVRWKDIHDYRVVERNDARPQLAKSPALLEELENLFVFFRREISAHAHMHHRYFPLNWAQ